MAQGIERMRYVDKTSLLAYGESCVASRSQPRRDPLGEEQPDQLAKRRELFLADDHSAPKTVAAVPLPPTQSSGR